MSEKVSVTKIAKMGCSPAWEKLSEPARHRKLEYARDAIAALGFTPLHDYWQPIETAPRNGSHILLASTKTGERSVGGWNRHHGQWVKVPGIYGMKPTHWMPLADLPQ